MKKEVPIYVHAQFHRELQNVLGNILIRHPRFKWSAEAIHVTVELETDRAFRTEQWDVIRERTDFILDSVMPHVPHSDTGQPARPNLVVTGNVPKSGLDKLKESYNKEA